MGGPSTGKGPSGGVCAHGGSGRPRVEPEDVREVFLRSYRIVYRVIDEELFVLTVFEGHRLLPEGVVPDDQDTP
jgi:plasmid stabilization system protein ParE